MGLFSFLGKRLASHADSAEPAPKNTIPTVKVDFDAYIPVYLHETLPTLQGFSSSELHEIGQHIAKNKYQADTDDFFASYFQGREWHWPELEFWIDYAKKEGFPASGPWDALRRALVGRRPWSQEKRERLFVRILIHTICDRARFHHEIDESKRLGIDYEIFFVFDFEARFYEYAKEHALTKMHPLIPGLAVLIKSHLPEFDEH